MDTAIPEPVDTEKPESGEGWVKTSVSLRASTRRRLKTWAAAHDMRIQPTVKGVNLSVHGLKRIIGARICGTGRQGGDHAQRGGNFRRSQASDNLLWL